MWDFHLTLNKEYNDLYLHRKLTDSSSNIIEVTAKFKIDKEVFYHLKVNEQRVCRKIDGNNSLSLTELNDIFKGNTKRFLLKNHVFSVFSENFFKL